MALSALATKIRSAPPDESLRWDVIAAAVEVLNNAIGSVVVGASTAAANPGSDASQAFAVQGVTGGEPVAVAIPTATPVSSIAYEASHVLKNAAGVLIAVVGYNSGGAQFIQLFNSATVPADTAVPVLVQAVAATANFVINVPITGLPFSTGIAISNSSTGPTKTLGSANCYFTAVVK